VITYRDINCPVDCEVGNWSFKPCDISTGKQEKTRNITVTAKNVDLGAKSCDEFPLSQNENCNVDCVMSDWIDSSDCNKNTGTKNRVKKVQIRGWNNGVSCTTQGAIDQVGATTTPVPTNCKVDCVMSDWVYGNCVAQADGTAKRTKTRNILQNSLNGGNACGSLKEEESCSIDCQVGNWTYGTCNVDTGIRTDTRNIIQPPINTDRTCPPRATEVPCPVNCSMSDWSNWSCNESTGVQTRTRSILYPSSNGYDINGNYIIGSSCGSRTESKQCDVDCKLGDWTYGTCNVDTGTRIRKRDVLKYQSGLGKKCEDIYGVGYKLQEVVSCPVNCELSDWKDVDGICNKSDGTKLQEQSVLVSAKNGGLACSLDSLANPKTIANVGDKRYKRGNCIVNCELSDWSDWSSCDKVTGLQTKTRSVTVTGKNGGQNCSIYGIENTLGAKGNETKTCSVNCEMSEWSNYTTCDKNGEQSRNRSVTVTGKNGGTECSVNTLGSVQTETKQCPFNCVLSDVKRIYTPYGDGCKCDWVDRITKTLPEKNGGSCIYNGLNINKDSYDISSGSGANCPGKCYGYTARWGYQCANTTNGVTTIGGQSCTYR